jgi:hypothetical protein
MMAPVRYDLAVAAWRGSETITILSGAGEPIAYFPLDFVIAGGHPEWTYIISAIQQVTENAAGAEWRLEDPDGNPVVSSDRPHGGKYVYRVQDAFT